MRLTDGIELSLTVTGFESNPCLVEQGGRGVHEVLLGQPQEVAVYAFISEGSQGECQHAEPSHFHAGFGHDLAVHQGHVLFLYRDPGIKRIEVDQTPDDCRLIGFGKLGIQRFPTC